MLLQRCAGDLAQRLLHWIRCSCRVACVHRCKIYFGNAYGIETRIRAIPMMMRHSRLAIAAGLALLVLAVGVQSIQAQQVSTALASKAPEASSIAATAQTNGHVRVIVLLNAPNIANQARPDEATIAATRQQVAGLQDTVLANSLRRCNKPAAGLGFHPSPRPLRDHAGLCHRRGCRGDSKRSRAIRWSKPSISIMQDRRRSCIVCR